MVSDICWRVCPKGLVDHFDQRRLIGFVSEHSIAFGLLAAFLGVAEYVLREVGRRQVQSLLRYRSLGKSIESLIEAAWLVQCLPSHF